MIERKDVWQSWYYMVPRFFMTLTGLWPYHPILNRCLRFVPIFILCSSILLPQFLYISTMTDTDDLFECMPPIAFTIIFSLKLAMIMVNTKKIKACLKTIEDDWLSLTDTEKAILQRHAIYGQYLTISYAVYMQLTGFLYMLKSIVLIDHTSNSTRSALTKLPYRVEYGHKIDQHFYPILVHCCMTMFFHVCVTIAADTLYYTLIQHACGMFSIVGQSLERISQNSNADFNLKPDKTTDSDYRKALGCLRRHLHVIELAELIESTFTNIFLVSISLNMIGGSICGMQVLIHLNDTKDKTAPFTIYVAISRYIAQLVHLFLQFWQAQYLLDCSTIPYESICRVNWYYTSERCRKILLLIMIRTILPCRITAGKLVTLSIESFGVVLKTSISYFMVLRSFQ